MPGIDQLPYERDLLGDVAGRQRGDARAKHTEPVHILVKTAGVELGDFHRVGFFKAGLFHDLVLAFVRVVGKVADIGDVLHVFHPVAAMAEPADNDVEGDIAFRMAEMGMAVNGRAADIDAHDTGMERFELLFGPAERVVNEKCHVRSNVILLFRQL